MRDLRATPKININIFEAPISANRLQQEGKVIV